MVRLIIVLSVLLLPASALRSQTSRPSRSHENAAAQLVQLLQLEKMTQASISVMVESMAGQNQNMAQLRDVLMEFFEEYMRWEELEPEYVRIYAAAFSEPELRELVAFYKTPVGRKTIDLMPRLMQQGAELGQRQITPHLPELERRVQARLRGGSRP